MHDAFVVGGCEPLHNLDRDINRSRRRQRPMVETAAERFSFQL